MDASVLGNVVLARDTYLTSTLFIELRELCDIYFGHPPSS
jgi:hypothetical protein